VLYIRRVKKRINKQFPRFLKRELNKRQIKKLHFFIDKVVREAREPRSTAVDFVDRPENFLINLFKPFIKKTVWTFCKYNNVKKKSCTEWAEEITRTLILGDATEREDRRKEIQPFLDAFVRGEKRQLSLSDRKVRARIKECLSNAVKAHEFFVNPLPWAQDCATTEGSQCYNPDYNKEKREDLELQKEEAHDLIERWESGEFRDTFSTKQEFLEYIDCHYIDTPLEQIDKQIAQTKRNTHLIGYLFGSDRKFGYLYRRLKDLHNYRLKQVNKISFQASMDDFAADGESPEDLLIGRENTSEETFYDDEVTLKHAEDIEEDLPGGLTSKQLFVYFKYSAEKLSFREIAKLYNMSPQNAHRLFHKAKRKIQALQR